MQNSLDAGAATVRITRQRIKGVPCLRIWDDGDGVIPEFTRADALRYIATNIGHSRKRNLSVQERHALMTQGQYGIGLLGFWSLGERLEMRSSVPGQQPMRLILHADDPRYEIEPLRGRLLLDERWTEIVVMGIKPSAQSILVGRRATDYLAAELRGQLLSREVSLLYEDHQARGRAPKALTIRLELYVRGPAAGEPLPAPPTPTGPDYTDDSLPLFPPGPLDHAAISPATLRIPCGGRRSVRAQALDRDGRPVATEFLCRWHLTADCGHLEAADTPEAVVIGADDPAEGMLHHTVTAAGNQAEAEAAVQVRDDVGSSRSAEGIPAPSLVEDPGANWRSRWREERWEVNAAHRDFRAVADKPAYKLRYLAALFAKEIVLRSSGDPRLERPLEQLVEVFSYADLRLVRGGRRKGRRCSEYCIQSLQPKYKYLIQCNLRHLCRHKCSRRLDQGEPEIREDV